MVKNNDQNTDVIQYEFLLCDHSDIDISEEKLYASHDTALADIHHYSVLLLHLYFFNVTVLHC